MSHWTKATSARWQRASFLALLVSGLAVLYTLPVGSVVWATPQQSPLRQTIPTLTPTPIPSWIWVGGPGVNVVDYGPSGMPDFDQKQEDWHDSASPEAWTYCGPVAIADVLWWLDSWFEPGIAAPPEVSDGHDLITSFGSWDDHDAQNVLPLVNDLATRLGTNGAIAGTEISALVPALQTYVMDKGLQDSYVVTMTASPSFEQLLSWVGDGDGIVLLLGFWEWQGDQWVYLGGHYVAVAGVEPVNRYMAVSDPFRDAWEAQEAALGRSPVTHDYPHNTDVHNDAQYVSHDAYRVVATEGPGGVGALESYVPAFAGIQNFVGQNVAAALAPYLGDYSGSPVITTKVDYALVLVRKPDSYTLHLPIILKGAQ
jgi:hypothetical protein